MLEDEIRRIAREVVREDLGRPGGDASVHPVSPSPRDLSPQKRFAFGECVRRAVRCRAS